MDSFKLCPGAGKFKAIDEVVLILLNCCKTMPAGYAVRSAANPQATEKGRRLNSMTVSAIAKVHAGKTMTDNTPQQWSEKQSLLQCETG